MTPQQLHETTSEFFELLPKYRSKIKASVEKISTKKRKFDDKSPFFPPKRLLFTEVIHRLCPSCGQNEGHSLSNSDFEPC